MAGSRPPERAGPALSRTTLDPPQPARGASSARPRFRDIAAEAGVGTATVERVLNRRGNVSPETARRVLAAAEKLGTNRILPSAHQAAVRVEVILVRRETTFFARLNAAFESLAPTHRSLVLYRTFLEENTPEAIGRRIEAVAAEREAFIVVVQDHPRIVDALRGLDRESIPVVLLVSDVGYGGGALYVGIDNESAGRTAGFLMRAALGGRSGAVVTLCHSGAYAVHRQRVIGFSQYFADPDDRITFDQCLITRDTQDLAYRAVRQALRDRPDIVGIYHAGGGNEGAVRAVAEGRRAQDMVYIGHELSPTNRRSLERGTMLVALDQQPELQVRRAIETVELAVGLRQGRLDRSPIPFRIVTPENL